MKTKKVDRVDLPASSFAYVGDPEDTNTWRFPVYFFNDLSKTVNHIKDALGRFDTTKGIPEQARADVWLVLYGAGLSHGIRIEPREFTRMIPEAEMKAIELNDKEAPSDAELEEVIAMADRQADAFLRSLGLE